MAHGDIVSTHEVSADITAIEIEISAAGDIYVPLGFEPNLVMADFRATATGLWSGNFVAFLMASKWGHAFNYSLTSAVGPITQGHLSIEDREFEPSVYANGPFGTCLKITGITWSAAFNRIFLVAKR